MLQMVSTPVGVVCGTFNSVAGGSQVRGGVVCALRIVYSTHLESPSSIIFVYQRLGSSFFSVWDFSPMPSLCGPWAPLNVSDIRRRPWNT